MPLYVVMSRKETCFGERALSLAQPRAVPLRTRRGSCDGQWYRAGSHKARTSERFFASTCVDISQSWKRIKRSAANSSQRSSLTLNRGDF